MNLKSLVPVSLGTCLLLSACVQVPDVGLGRQALAQGKREEALWHFQQLAEKGIPEAQLALGNVKSTSRDTREQASALYWYRQAAPKMVRANTQLGKFLARVQPEGEASLIEAEKLLKAALASGDSSALPPLMQLYVEHEALWPGVNPETYIAQAKAQGLPQAYVAQMDLYRKRGQYQAHLADIEKSCQALLDVQPACYAELVAVYRTKGQLSELNEIVKATQAAFQEHRIEALSVDRVARYLVDTLYPAPQPQLAKSLLEQIAPTYPAAWMSLAQLQLQFPFIGDAPTLQATLEKAITSGSVDAELLYGNLLMEGKIFPANPKAAQRHLSEAAPHLPKAEYLLGVIYKEGLLGEAEPRKAFDLLLNAARRGSGQADLALAHLYSDAKGVRPQLEYAWIFASLALEQERPGAAALVANLSTRLTPVRKQSALAQLAAEKSYRKGLPLNVSPMPLQEISDVISEESNDE